MIKNLPIQKNEKLLQINFALMYKRKKKKNQQQ